MNATPGRFHGRVTRLAVTLAVWPALLASGLLWAAVTPRVRVRRSLLPEPLVDAVLLLLAAWVILHVLALLEAAWRATQGQRPTTGRLGWLLARRPLLRGASVPGRSLAERLDEAWWAGRRITERPG